MASGKGGGGGGVSGICGTGPWTVLNTSKLNVLDETLKSDFFSAIFGLKSVSTLASAGPTRRFKIFASCIIVYKTSFLLLNNSSLQGPRRGRGWGGFSPPPPPPTFLKIIKSY